MGEEFNNNQQNVQEMDNSEQQNNSNEQNNAENSNNNKSSDNNLKNNDLEKKFSQSQVSRMMAKEKSQGKASVYRELGINPNDSKMINMLKAFISSQQVDEQKNETEQNDRLQELERRTFLAEAKVEAMKAKVKPEYVDDIVELASLKVDENNDLKSVLASMKQRYSVCFESDNSQSSESVGQKGTGSSIKGDAGKPDKKSGSLGSRLAAQRKNQTGAGKKSFWN